MVTWHAWLLVEGTWCLFALKSNTLPTFTFLSQVILIIALSLNKKSARLIFVTHITCRKLKQIIGNGALVITRKLFVHQKTADDSWNLGGCNHRRAREAYSIEQKEKSQINDLTKDKNSELSTRTYLGVSV